MYRALNFLLFVFISANLASAEENAIDLQPDPINELTPKATQEPEVPDLLEEAEIIKEVIKTTGASFLPLQEEQEMPQEPEVNLIEQINAALNTKDFETIKPYLASDFFIMLNDQILINDAVELNSHLKKLSEAQIEIDNIRSDITVHHYKHLANNLAFYNGTIIFSDDSKNLFEGNFTLTLQYLDDTWKVVGLHFNKVNAKNLSPNMTYYFIFFIGLAFGMIIGSFLCKVIFFRSKKV